jgi:alpha-glucosidase
MQDARQFDHGGFWEDTSLLDWRMISKSSSHDRSLYQICLAQNWVPLVGSSLAPFNNHQGDGALSIQTTLTNLYHRNGLSEYDAHSLCGRMISTSSRWAMINGRPGLRPLIIIRSTFAGAGTHFEHCNGDSISTWLQYRTSVQQMIEFVGLFQMLMTGSDVYSFNGNTTLFLCSRWAMLGAVSLPMISSGYPADLAYPQVYTFYCKHKLTGTLFQEFYRWPLVADAGRKAMSMRYQLLEYLYTAMHRQNKTGDPTISALFFVFHNDTSTFAKQHQVFFGESTMVSPMLKENATIVEP